MMLIIEQHIELHTIASSLTSSHRLVCSDIIVQCDPTIDLNI